MSEGAILTLNAGSSSLKFAVFRSVAGLEVELRGELQELHTEPRLQAVDRDGKVLIDRRWPAGAALTFSDALKVLLEFADSHLGAEVLMAVGHRVVHGGAAHVTPEIVTPQLLTALEALIPLDPLHIPDNVAPIRALSAERPDLRQVACFDTAFHHTMPMVATRFAIPRALALEGVRRYGFHGLSYEYIAGYLKQHLPALAKGKVIVAHLGSGASLCALDNARSVATTMGFSALDGLMMATRCGSLDPGVLLYLSRRGLSVREIEDMLYRQSGLLGVSGVSGDIRVLLASGDEHAREAIDLFTYRAALDIGALASALGGLDGLVFTAGIGEHSAAVRQAICDRLSWFGVSIDSASNEANASRINAQTSKVSVHVIITDEEAMIARHTRSVLRADF